MNTIRAFRSDPKVGNRYQVIDDEVIGATVVTVERVADGYCSVGWTDETELRTLIVPIDDLLAVPRRTEHQTTHSGTGPISVEHPYPRMDRDYWSHLWVSVPIVTCGTGRKDHQPPHPLISEAECTANWQQNADPPHYCTQPITVIEDPNDSGQVPWFVVLVGSIGLGLIFTAIEALPIGMFLALVGVVAVIAVSGVLAGSVAFGDSYYGRSQR